MLRTSLLVMEGKINWNLYLQNLNHGMHVKEEEIFNNNLQQNSLRIISWECKFTYL